jgi:hypothetical protein
MTRTVYPLAIPDVAAFARSLGKALKERQPLKPEPPSHVELLNLIARAVGLRNMQALRERALREPAPTQPSAGVAAPAADELPAAQPTAPAVATLSDNARKALHQFDSQGRLMRWPVKYSVQKLVMWVLWTHFDAKRIYTESEVNAVLKRAHLFFDHATLRRELINHQLMARKSDCSEYRKLPARPDDEARALLGAWRARTKA